jgi:hypothetical protein
MRLRAGLAKLWVFIPLALTALLLAAYTWWWQEVAESVRAAANQFQIDQHAQGREALWDALDVSGFPYRVEAQFNGPHLTAPDRGFAWDGKAVVLGIQPLKPHHIALSFEGHQHLIYIKDNRYIEGGLDANQAHINIVAGSAGTAQVGLDVEGLSGQGDFDAKHIELVVQNATASARQGEGDDDATTTPIDIDAALKNVALRGDIVLPLGPAITLVDLKAHLRFPNLPPDGPTPSLVAAWRATDTPIAIEAFHLDWGGVTLAAHGELKLDALARPEGRLQLKIGNHRRLVEVMTAEGWISAQAQESVMTALNTLAFMSGDPERRIDVAVRFADGSAFLELFGLVPIRVGPVPVLIPPPPVITPQG